MALSPSQRFTVLGRVSESVLDAYRKGEISDEDLERYGIDIGIIDPFEQVEGSATTVPQEPSYLDRIQAQTTSDVEDLGSILDSLQGSVQSAGSGFAQFLGDTGPGALLGEGSALADLPITMGGESAFGYDPAEESADILAREASAAQTRAQEVLDTRTGFHRGALQTSQDVAKSLPSIASLLSPALAPVAGGYIFGQEYGAARRGGVNPVESFLRAVPQAGSEFAIERLGTGRFAENILNLSSDIVKVPGRAGLTSIIEGLSEGATTQVQLGIDKILSEVGPSEEIREFAKRNLPKDVTEWWDETSRAVLAGSVMGGGVSSTMEAIRATSERGELAGKVLNATEADRARDTAREAIEADRPRTTEIPIREPVQGTLFERLGMGQGLGFEEQQAERQRQLEIDAGISVGRRQAQEQDVAERDRAGRRQQLDAAVVRQDELQSAVEEGDRSPATLSALAAANREVRRAEMAVQEAQAPVEVNLLSNTKVIDNNGKPVRLYHGTKEKFKTFDINKAGSSKDAGWLGTGVYFTDQPITAEFYSQSAGAESPVVVEAFADLRNPFMWGKKSRGVENLPERIKQDVIDLVGESPTEKDLADAITKVLRSRGHDGVIAETTGLSLDTPAKEVVVFSPEQVIQSDSTPNQTEDTRIRPAEEAVTEPTQAPLFTRTQAPIPIVRTKAELSARTPAQVTQEAATKSPTVVKQAKKKVRKPKKQTEEVKNVRDELKALKGTMRMDGTPLPQGTGVTVTRAVDALVDKIGSKNANVLSKILVDGNMRIVATNNDVPSGALPLGTRGAFDGDTTYIIADQLNPDNVVGDMLTVAAHEIKHAADISGSPSLKTSLGSFVGEEANTQLKTKIEALAERGNVAAINAITKAKKADATLPGSYDLELSAYFVNEARDERKNSPLAKSILRDVVSAVRTTAKNALPGEYEVNLNDVAYLSDQLLNEVAVTGERLTGELPDDKSSLPMVAGRQAQYYEDAVQAGIVIKSRDGRGKFWVSDKNSNISLPPEVELLTLLAKRSIPTGEGLAQADQERLTNLLNTAGEPLTDQETGDRYQTYTLGDILNHPELFRQYPDLKDVVVVFKDMSKDPAKKGMNVFGSYHEGVVTINVAPRLPDGSTGITDAYDGHAHRVLLHEIQHAIQDAEGFDTGTNPESILATNEEYVNSKSRATSAKRLLKPYALKIAGGDLTEFGIGDISQLPSQHVRNVITAAIGEARAAVSPDVDDLDATSEAAIQALAVLGSYPATRTPSIEAGLKIAQTLATDKKLQRDLYKKAFDTYQAKQGETEARYTENNIDNELAGVGNWENSWTATWKGSRPTRGILNEGAAESTEVAAAREALERAKARRDRIAQEAEVSNDPSVRSLLQEAELDVQITNSRYLRARRGGNALAMAADLPRTDKVGDDEQAQNQIKRAIKRLLVPGGGFDSDMNEILRHSASLPASLAIRGTHLGNNLLRAMEDVAKKGNKDIIKFREMIGQRLEQIDTLDTPAERRAALDALERQYPGVGKAVAEIRDFKLTLTEEIMDLRARSGIPMDKKERAIYTKMAQNAERYTTRAYLATYNETTGKDYGKHIMEQYKNDPTSQEGRIVADGLEFLANNHLVIPTIEDMKQLKVADIRRLYKTWIGPSTKFKGKKGKTEMIENLSKLPPKSKEHYDKKAMEVVRDMLGLNKKLGGERSKFRPKMMQNRTIIEARTDMPEPLRKLMGEITDPLLREAISLQRMIGLITKTKVLTEVFERGEGRWWADERTEVFNVQLNNVNYGPMNGKWINQDTEDALMGSIIPLSNIDSALSESLKNPDLIMQAMLGKTMPVMHRIMGIQKTWQVVASMFNMGMNLAGAIFIMAPSQGMLNPVTYYEGMRDTAAALGLEISDRFAGPRQVSLAEEVVFAGVTDSATMGEFRSQAFQSILKEIQKLDPNAKSFPIQVMNTAWKGISAQGVTANALRQFYAFMDVWVKVATYKDRKTFLTKFNKAESMGWTDEQIVRKAGYEAAGTNISYERAIPLVKLVERNVPFAMFLTYFSEVPRAITMSFMQAAKDLELANKATTAEGRRLATIQGTTRFLGTMGATAGIIGSTIAALDSEDEEEKRRRKLDVEYMQDQILIPMGQNKDGNTVYISLNRIDPYGPFNEAVVNVARAPLEEKPKAALRAIADLFVPSRGVMSVWKLMSDATVGALSTVNEGAMQWDQKRKKTTALEDQYPRVYQQIRSVIPYGDIGENTVEMVEAMFVPSQIRLRKENEKVISITEDDVPIADLIDAMGGKVHVRNPDKSLEIRTYEYGDVIERLRDQRKELNENIGNMSTNQVISQFTDMIETEKEAFYELSEMYDGYLAYDGRTKAMANELIGNKRLARQLQYNKFESSIVTKDALKRWYNERKKDKTVDREQLREDYNLLREVYGSALSEGDE